MTDWCILRTSGRSTLTLADGLREAGYDVWTPVEVQKTRLPRGRKAKISRTVPIMPSYVFARANHLAALFALAADPTRSLPAFSVMRYRERIPLIAEREFQALRNREERSRLASARTRRCAPYNRGDAIKPTEGPWAGMSGIVETSSGKHTLVDFGGRHVVKIATFLLRENEIGTDCPISGAAA